MKIFNSNTALFAGFFVSFAAIVVNALVLANINNRLGAVDAESARLNEAVRRQTDYGNEATAKFGSYRMMFHLAALVPPARRADADEDAAVALYEALLFLFAAANERSVTEIRRVEAETMVSEESNRQYEQLKATEEANAEKPKTEENKKTEEKSKIEEKQKTEKALATALGELETAGAAGDEDMRKKISAIETISVAAAAAENPNEFIVRLFPVAKSLSSRWVESVKRKQARLAELEADKSRLIKYQGYSTFAALVLQMLGLMFVILKDVLKMRESAD